MDFNHSTTISKHVECFPTTMCIPASWFPCTSSPTLSVSHNQSGAVEELCGSLSQPNTQQNTRAHLVSLDATVRLGEPNRSAAKRAPKLPGPKKSWASRGGNPRDATKFEARAQEEAFSQTRTRHSSCENSPPARTRSDPVRGAPKHRSSP